MEFRQVISLGAWCQVAHHIHRRFPDQPSSVFDWVVAPHDSLVEVLKDDGARLVQKFTKTHNDTAVFCDAYGLLYVHDFPLDPVTNTVTVDAMTTFHARAKLKAKMGKFLAACDNCLPTLLVRFGGFGLPARPYPYVKDDTVFTFSQLEDLDAQLARKFQSTPYHLAWIYHPEMTTVSDMPAARGNISTHAFPLPEIDKLSEQDRWMGTESMWDEFFSRFTFAKELAPSTHADALAV